MRFPRSSGILLHPTSLPSPYGIGDLGAGAWEFIDFLIESRQRIWQVLPLGPTGYGDSPYQSFSAFAGNPLLISPDTLVKSGFLPAESIVQTPDLPQEKVDFGEVIDFKKGLLQQAYVHFIETNEIEKVNAFEAFKIRHSDWLDDFALFMALKEYHKDLDGGVWNRWPRKLADRDPKTIEIWKSRLKGEIELNKFGQFLFFKQWLPLKKYANENGIRIIGDVPIFVALDSADVWANRELFFLDENGDPSVVAGVPPDYFSETGQRWGNPLYRWDRIAEDGYKWWVARLGMVLSTVDVVRIDHFRGFDAYWEIPADEPTAVKGRWVKGPGLAFFEAMHNSMGQLPIIAEDLGVITPAVEALRDRFEFPGMKILQFAFGGERNSNFLPHNFGRNCAVYTGTHDNETTLGWYQNASSDEQDHIRRYAARDGSDIAWDMIRLAHASVADTAVVPLQDVLSLDNMARMNFPGKSGGWWTWRFQQSMLNDSTAARLREITELFGRALEDSGESQVGNIDVEEV
jgi:4-alpha-glucanotransferase